MLPANYCQREIHHFKLFTKYIYLFQVHTSLK